MHPSLPGRVPQGLPGKHMFGEHLTALPALQLIQAKLADMYTTTQAARSFIYATAAAADEGWPTRLVGCS